jgi:hypothetical protein
MQMALNFETHTMNPMTHLTNQHVLEWESRLQHIDEMAARAHELHGKAPEGSEAHKKLSDIRNYREQLSLHLETAKSLPETEDAYAHPSDGGIHAVLEATGSQLEKILGSIVGVDQPRRRKVDQTD